MFKHAQINITVPGEHSAADKSWHIFKDKHITPLPKIPKAEAQPSWWRLTLHLYVDNDDDEIQTQKGF